ncbi:Zinc finger protein 407 [Frankliniella fusca]|uniref:Zinc finger protein 407 n=1 Tax=Frankliniella fusca TaxID=407009 RepID=A0AAE1LDM0_9NEOP|nr:Zinc finger protein 407 [Frankliniella fusca]
MLHNHFRSHTGEKSLFERTVCNKELYASRLLLTKSRGVHKYKSCVPLGCDSATIIAASVLILSASKRVPQTEREGRVGSEALYAK